MIMESTLECIIITQGVINPPTDSPHPPCHQVSTPSKFQPPGQPHRQSMPIPQVEQTITEGHNNKIPSPGHIPPTSCAHPPLRPHAGLQNSNPWANPTDKLCPSPPEAISRATKFQPPGKPHRQSHPIPPWIQPGGYYYAIQSRVFLAFSGGFSSPLHSGGWVPGLGTGQS